MQKLCVKKNTFFQSVLKIQYAITQYATGPTDLKFLFRALKSVNPNKAGLFEGSSYFEKS